MRGLTRTAMVARLAAHGIVGIAAFLITIAVIGGYIAATAVVGGWFLMLLFGVIHSYAAAVPAIGFLPSWGSFFLLRAVLGHILWASRGNRNR